MNLPSAEEICRPPRGGPRRADEGTRRREPQRPEASSLPSTLSLVTLPVHIADESESETSRVRQAFGAPRSLERAKDERSREEQREPFPAV